MSIPPKFQNFVKVASGSVETSAISAINTIDMYLDFVCPYACKLFLKLDKEVIPLLAKKYPGKFRFVFRPVVQPWHALASASTAESLLAVNQLVPQESWNYARVLFEHQTEFFDTSIIELNRNQVYEKLADFAVKELDLTKKYNVSAADIYKKLHIRGKAEGEEGKNIDSGVTLDLKYFIRQHRAMSVNVTPTIAVNGVIVPSIESSTTVEELDKIFASYL